MLLEDVVPGLQLDVGAFASILAVDIHHIVPTEDDHRRWICTTLLHLLETGGESLAGLALGLDMDVGQVSEPNDSSGPTLNDRLPDGRGDGAHRHGGCAAGDHRPSRGSLV